jgi:excisionase family DNA binding protein
MTPKRVQQESSLSKGTINRAIQSGELKSVKPTPRARRIPVEAFAEWIARMKAQA